jgi:hypothetical protein
VKGVERTMAYGIVSGLVVSQANLALFEDLVHRQVSFEAVGWSNWFLYVLVPILAGGMVLYYGRTSSADDAGLERKPERAMAASITAVAIASVVLRWGVPAILHAGDVLPGRLPRSLADGFNFVAQYARIAPIAGLGHGYELAATVASGAVIAAAVAFGALAFERRAVPVLASAVVGGAWGLIGWYVPGGAGARIIGACWPVFVLGSVGVVLGVSQRRVSASR